ncbi:XcbB/CpsF family capsular polysaccharide biosynthesis protein [Weissella sagaensis]|uniref:XcbB/CpsF family capsular polysaccharide biosynthesis protein n=1 Tax=Weissella sagaensis TaxID=2559928 RepID=UPI00214BFE13|nr:XcbB/CpsF family capsular polysaccharide biosynthesis protein [Weissella sagaensis]
MAKLLIFSDEENIEYIHKQIITKLNDELEKIDVVLTSEPFDDLPYNWNQLKKQYVNKSDYNNGMYIHATKEAPLLYTNKDNNIFTILFEENYLKNKDNSLFSLTVLKKKQFNKISGEQKNLTKEVVIDISNKGEIDNFIQDFEDIEELKINTPKVKQNILQFSRKDKLARSLLEFLVSKDFTLVNFINQTNVFSKREFLSKYIPDSVLGLSVLNFDGVFYTVEEKIKKDNNAPNRLLVIFSSMPGSNEYYSSKFEERAFVKHFPTIQKLVVPNTNILRIVDSNLVYGSHYINSNNFNNYEDNIQKVILKVSKELNVNENNIVLYGTSKGATGALVHSLIGNYKSVTVDPILNAQEYNDDMNNIHYIKNDRIQNLIPKINELIKSGPKTKKHVLIRSPQVQFNYKISEQIINNDCIRFYDQNDSNIKSHAEIGKNSVSEILMFLNSKLLGLEV